MPTNTTLSPGGAGTAVHHDLGNSNARYVPVKNLTFILLLLLMTLLSGTAHAFLWFGGDAATGKIGIDLKQGYDVNTVVTVTGRVTRLPHVDGSKNMLLEIASGNDTIHVSLGTESSWGKNALAISLNDEVTVKGSKAQGSNGEIYLLAQRLSDRNAGSQRVIRDEHGNVGKGGANAAPATHRASSQANPPKNGSMLHGGTVRSGGRH